MDPNIELPDVKEYGAIKDGLKQVSEKRLFMQLLVLNNCGDTQRLVAPLRESGLEAVLYEDFNHPRVAGLLTLSEDPQALHQNVRRLFARPEFSGVCPDPAWTMLGRTYSGGFEQDLEDWLLQKPRRNVFDERLSWAVWYPLRRKGEFETLPKDEQRAILWEHAKLGMGYGSAGLAHDVRLACHGLDAHDNEFVIGVLAAELHSISRLIQDMRKTRQTSNYIESMGPFFVGNVFARFHL